jgi:hypothetical protein
MSKLTIVSECGSSAENIDGVEVIRFNGEVVILIGRSVTTAGTAKNLGVVLTSCGVVIRGSGVFTLSQWGESLADLKPSTLDLRVWLATGTINSI